jgi:hypothetical protein
VEQLPSPLSLVLAGTSCTCMTLGRVLLTQVVIQSPLNNMHFLNYEHLNYTSHIQEGLSTPHCQGKPSLSGLLQLSTVV